MSIVFPYTDLVAELQTLIDHRLNSETIRLWRGSHTPGLGDSTFFYLANEANFGGYRRLPLTFTPAVLNDDSAAFTQSAIQVWLSADTINTPQVISGVFALDASLNLAWADRLPNGPVLVDRAGVSITYQAVIDIPPHC